MGYHASYGWIIDADHVPVSGLNGRVGVVGPRRIHPRIEAVLERKAVEPPTERWTGLLSNVRRWRCKDSDGEIYYEGRYIGPESRMRAPLEDFCQPDAGATDIEYLDQESNEWGTL